MDLFWCSHYRGRGLFVSFVLTKTKYNTTFIRISFVCWMQRGVHEKLWAIKNVMKKVKIVPLLTNKGMHG